MNLVEDIQPCDLDIDAERFPSWRPGQYQLLLDTIDCPTRFSGHCAPCGCHRKGQQIIKYDGTLINVEDIVVGDLLMGPDSKPRRVLSLIRGRGRMYSINPIKGDPFVVNEDHVLSLASYGAHSNTCDISVRDYLNKSNNFKWNYKLFRAAVDCWETKRNLPIDPYFLGALLGDGGLVYGITIHKPDKEIGDLAREQAILFDLKARPLFKKGKVGITGYQLSLKSTKGKGKCPKNPLLEIIRALGLSVSGEKKFVPHDYKTGDRQQRLSILAGLLDTDGSKSIGGYDFISVSPQLSNDVAFLARSVGLAAYIKPCKKSCQTGVVGTYYRVSISGDCRIIPCRIPRKKTMSARKQIKNVLRTGFDVKQVGTKDYIENYYGFQLNADGRYLLGDFTVTHNSGKSVVMVANPRVTGARTLILTPFKGLQDQLTGEFNFVVDLRGKNNYSCRLLSTNCEMGSPRCTIRKSSLGAGLCEHKAAVEKAARAEIVVMNYSCWFHQVYGSGVGEFDTLIMDEADTAEAALSEFLSFTLNSKEALMDLNMAQCPHWNDPVHMWATWAESLVSRLKNATEQAEKAATESDEPHILEYFFHLRTLLRKITLLAKVSDSDWIAEPTRDGIRFDPIWPGRFAEKYLFRGIKRVILFSGTLNRKAFELLGVRENNFTFYDYESRFHPFYNPLILSPVGDFRYPVSSDLMTRAIQTFDRVVEARKDRKGILHTISFSHLNQFIEQSKYARLFISNDIKYAGGARRTGDVVDTFKAASPPAVLASPSITSGWDFPDDYCRYQFILKVPFADATSLVAKARKKLDPEYYNNQAMTALIQICSRADRSETDYNENIICDIRVGWFLKHNAHLAAKWFLGARGSGRFRRLNEGVIPDPIKG